MTPHTLIGFSDELTKLSSSEPDSSALDDLYRTKDKVEGHDRRMLLGFLGTAAGGALAAAAEDSIVHPNSHSRPGMKPTSPKGVLLRRATIGLPIASSAYTLYHALKGRAAKKEHIDAINRGIREGVLQVQL